MDNPSSMDASETRLARLQRLDVLLALGLGGLTLAVYLATLTPSLSYLSPDGNELATVPYVLGLAHSPGYPLYTWVGKLFTLLPVGDVAHRMNLMSAILGAAAVAGVCVIALVLLPPRRPLRRAAAATAALLLAISPTFWSQAVIAEVYAPNPAMIAATLLLLMRWERTRSAGDFFVFSLLFALSLGTHLSNLGFAPAFGVFILLTDPGALKRPSWWLAGFVGFGLGAAQFAWLPLRAPALNDALMLQRAPLTLEGIYRYTIGAFSELKFAFPSSALADRLVIYLDLLHQEFGLIPAALGVVGLAALLFQRTRHYFLFVGMYLVNVWFFIQYRAFDLEVFFLPAHWLWSVFVAFGLNEGLALVWRGLGRALATAIRARHASFLLSGGLLATCLVPLTGNWARNNHSNDVAVNDFYANVWELLPENATLLSQGGVFGYDVFYWRLVYGTRPDVAIPALQTFGPSAAGLRTGPLYSTTVAIGTQRRAGPGALQPGLAQQDLWQVPVLLGSPAESGSIGRPSLVLYRLSPDPPDLVDEAANPQVRLDSHLGAATLVGADVGATEVESGGRLHVVLYWSALEGGTAIADTTLATIPLEHHALGFGNLARYQTEVASTPGRFVVEDYWLVVPSTVPAGIHVLSVRLSGSGAIPLATLRVVNEQEAMERWLDVAGRSS
jgi:hypothetical protein